MAFSDQNAVGTVAGAKSQRDVLLLTFVGSIFTSAFLLFSIQPMFAKMVLPLLGGSPGVWSVAMVVFQTLLLAGYGYAHLSTKYLSLKTSAMVHMGLYLVTALALPIAVSSSLGEPPQSGQEFWLVGVFLLSVGLPFFAVAGNGPLLQAWFAQSNHPTAGDPYYLYRASNLGSFASLLLYPLVLEPVLAVKLQTQGWAIGFGLLGLMIGGAAWLVALNPGAPRTSIAEAATDAPTVRQILNWIVLSFVPSGLLVAVTAHISTDVAAAPFLWVVPLAIYLGTFIIVFRDPLPFPLELLEKFLPPMATFIVFNLAFPFHNITVSLALHLTFLLLVTLVCHGRLYQQRPSARHLTSFYLWMSLGGVIGGAFCGLAAPAIFNKVTEYPVLIFAALICLPVARLASRQDWVRQVGPWIAVALCLCAVMLLDRSLLPHPTMPILIAVMMTVGVALYRKPLMSIGATAALVILSFFGTAEAEFHRSFFGVHKVHFSNDGTHRQLSHGTTLHGSILIRNENGAPLPARPEPTTYYNAKAPMAEALRTIQERSPEGRNFGIVGLGAGSIVCNGRENDRWAYFEIDPTVVKIASDPAYFRFLSVCAPQTRMVVGDARLTLAKEQGAYDGLVIDAFTSDAIPVHLLTREAISMYLGKIKDDGLVIIHISNRHMELESVITATAKSLGVDGRAKLMIVPEGNSSITSSHVVALSKNPEALKALEAKGWRALRDRQTAQWTDDYSNIIGAIWRTYVN